MNELNLYTKCSGLLDKLIYDYIHYEHCPQFDFYDIDCKRIYSETLDLILELKDDCIMPLCEFSVLLTCHDGDVEGTCEEVEYLIDDFIVDGWLTLERNEDGYKLIIRDECFERKLMMYDENGFVCLTKKGVIECYYWCRARGHYPFYDEMIDECYYCDTENVPYDKFTKPYVYKMLK